MFRVMFNPRSDDPVFLDPTHPNYPVTSMNGFETQEEAEDYIRRQVRVYPHPEYYIEEY